MDIVNARRKWDGPGEILRGSEEKGEEEEEDDEDNEDGGSDSSSSSLQWKVRHWKKSKKEIRP